MRATEAATQTVPVTGRKEYRPDIDGLRAVACLGVVLYHAFPGYVNGGFIGVDVFFVISGYLISAILYKNLFNPERPGRIGLVDFYIRRVRRILPALIVVLAFVAVVGYFFLLPGEYENLGQHIAGGSIYISNFILFWEYGSYFNADAITKPLLHLWSLGIEEQFYLVFPLFLWLAFMWRISLVVFLTAFTLISFMLGVSILQDGDANAAFYLPWYRFWELCAGALLSYVVMPREGGPLLKISARTGHVLSAAGTIMILFGFVYISRQNSFPGELALIPVAGSAMVICAGREGFVNRFFLATRPMVFLGLISYPLYLWHWPLISFSHLHSGGEPGAALKLAVIGCSLLLAAATFYFVEPRLRYGPRPKSKAAGLFVVLLAMGAGGTLLYKSHGLEYRFEPFAQHTQEVIAIDRQLLEKRRSCHAEFPEWQAAVDIRNDCFMEPKKKAAVYAIGDSHAGHLMWGLQHELNTRDYGFDLFASNSQAPFLDFITTYNTTSKIALDTIRIQAPLITRALRRFAQDPDSRIALLAYNPYSASVGIKDTSEGGQELSLTGRAADNLTPEEEQKLAQIYEAGAERTFGLFREHGKLALVILDIPLIPRASFHKCLASFRPYAPEGLRDFCAVDRYSYDKNKFVAVYNRTMREVAARYDNVECVDLSELVCDPKRCGMVRDGTVIYEDQGHLNESGSLIAAPYIMVRADAMLGRQAK